VFGSQVELNLSAYEATKHAVLLARLVRDLKIHFNKKFKAMRMERKEQVEKCEAMNVGEVLGLEYDFELEDVINGTKVDKNWIYTDITFFAFQHQVHEAEISPKSVETEASDESKKEISGKELKRIQA
jgi:hypothetical protein